MLIWEASTITVLLLPSISTLIMLPIAVALPPVVVPDHDGIIARVLPKGALVAEDLDPPPATMTRLAWASRLKPSGVSDHPPASMLIGAEAGIADTSDAEIAIACSFSFKFVISYPRMSTKLEDTIDLYCGAVYSPEGRSCSAKGGADLTFWSGSSLNRSLVFVRKA